MPDQHLEPLYGLRPAVIEAVASAIQGEDSARLRRLLEPLHPSDIADLIEQLDREQRPAAMTAVSPGRMPVILAELDEAVRQELLGSLGTRTAAEAISHLDLVDAVDVVESLEAEHRQDLLGAMPERARARVEESLAYPEDSAGRLMQRDVMAVPADWSAGQAVDSIQGGKDVPETFHDVFVVDGKRRPVGVLALDKLLRADRSDALADVMNRDVDAVAVSTDQEDVAMLFRDHDLISTPVVNDDGRLVGMITVDDIVDVIDEEAEEDLMRLGGVSRDDHFRAVLKTARARFTWLAVNLLTAILASIAIALFEATIDQIVALAILMPIVASMGGNAGTQTMTVAVRALAMRELGRRSSLRLVGKELVVAAINGVLFSILTGLVAALWFNETALGVIIGAAMVFNMLIAGLAGTAIPIGLQRLGVDPAIASTVFLTTVTDVVGFLSFLGLAAVFLL